MVFACADIKSWSFLTSFGLFYHQYVSLLQIYVIIDHATLHQIVVSLVYQERRHKHIEINFSGFPNS